MGRWVNLVSNLQSLGIRVMDKPIVFIEKLAREAGAIMREHYRRPIEIRRKPDGTPVTAVDLEISAHVCQQLRTHYPAHGLLTEETAADFRLAERGFIIDELDGTNAFIRRKPGFAFQAAYYENHDQLQAAVIYDPLRDLMLLAKPGEGVLLRAGSKTLSIRPMPVRRWQYLRFAHHRTYMTDTHRRIYQHLNLREEKVVSTGCVASKVFDFVLGRVDALIALNRFVAPWDWAPGQVILQELGYALTHLNGQPLHLADQRSPESFGYLTAPAVHIQTLVEKLAWLQAKASGQRLRSSQVCAA